MAFEYIENTGAAFGVLEGQGVFLTLIAGTIIAMLIWRYLRAGQPSLLMATSLGLVVGGAIGNVIDRLRLGYVVDFVAIGVWPKFNVADSAVVIGVLMLAWSMSRADHGARDVAVEPSADSDAHLAKMSGGPIANRYVEGG